MSMLSLPSIADISMYVLNELDTLCRKKKVDACTAIVNKNRVHTIVGSMGTT